MKSKEDHQRKEKAAKGLGQAWRNAGGFSLIELLIVVAIIAIIVAIAVPNFMSARRSAQSSSMIGDLRVIHTAETAYYTGPGKSSYGDFNELEGNRFLPTNFSIGSTSYRRHGYNGNLNLGNSKATFFVQTQHSSFSALSPSYYINETGTIRFNINGLATASDLPIGTR